MSGLVEELCEHGVGHPVRESAERVAKHYGHPVDVWLQHGCDGCCKKWENTSTSHAYTHATHSYTAGNLYAYPINSTTVSIGGNYMAKKKKAYKKVSTKGYKKASTRVPVATPVQPPAIPVVAPKKKWYQFWKKC